MNKMIDSDRFTLEEKECIEELKQTKTLDCKCRDLSPQEYELQIRQVTKQGEKLFKFFSFICFAVLVFFIVCYINDKEECSFMYPWLFILCIVLGTYMFIIGHMWTHKHDNKVYEFKRVVLKYKIFYNPRGTTWNSYSIAEVMPDDTIRYFYTREEMRKGDDLYEGKLLMADMIQEKGQTKTMFSIDRKSFCIIKRLNDNSKLSS